MSRQVKAIVAALLVVTCAIAAWNFFSTQRLVSDVISDDPRNDGISVYAHYQWFVNPNVLVFDLRSISGNNSSLDVSRVLLQYAAQMQRRNFNQVILSYKGTPKFVLRGDHFQTLGMEYGSQNPVYTLRTLPGNIYNLDGTPAFGTWAGGLIGVAGKQMEDLNDFHKRWYLADFAGSR